MHWTYSRPATTTTRGTGISSVKEVCTIRRNYDDIAGVYGELRRALLKAFDDSRAVPVQPVETPFGNLPGKTPQEITAIIVDILSNARYVDVAGTFSALLTIYRGEQDRRQREHALRTLKHLGEYNLHVWRQVGPGVQMALSDAIDRLSADERSTCRAALLTVWSEILSPDLSGTSFSADALHSPGERSELPRTSRKFWAKAIDGLFEALDRGGSPNPTRPRLSIHYGMLHDFPPKLSIPMSSAHSS